MSSPDTWAAALADFRNALQAGRVAHAYIVEAPVRADGVAFAEILLEHLLCTGAAPRPCGQCPGCRQARAHTHPDVVWIEPESRGRQITIERIRDTLHPRVRQTPFVDGGWRAGVLVDAECLNPAAANALLKTLEEPPPRTLILLLTAAPRQLLPTIRSRCQPLRLGAGPNDTPWRGRALDVIAAPVPPGVLERMGRMRGLRDLLEEARKAAAAESGSDDDAGDDPNAALVDGDVLAARANARMIAARREILETLVLWHRDLWLCAMGGPMDVLAFPDRAAELRAQAAHFTPAAAVAALREAEHLQRRFDRHLPAEQVLDAFALALPRGRPVS